MHPCWPNGVKVCIFMKQCAIDMYMDKYNVTMMRFIDLRSLSVKFTLALPIHPSEYTFSLSRYLLFLIVFTRPIFQDLIQTHGNLIDRISRQHGLGNRRGAIKLQHFQKSATKAGQQLIVF